VQITVRTARTRQHARVDPSLGSPASPRNGPTAAPFQCLLTPLDCYHLGNDKGIKPRKKASTIVSTVNIVNIVNVDTRNPCSLSREEKEQHTRHRGAKKVN
jgi:hypothetical protein